MKNSSYGSLLTGYTDTGSFTYHISLFTVLSKSLKIKGKQYALYRDPSYILRPGLHVSFYMVCKKVDLVVFNAVISSGGEAV